MKLTRRDPSAAKGQPSLTLGWEITPHTALGSAVSHWGRGQSRRSGAPQGSCGHTHGLSAPRSQEAPTSRCHVAGSPQDLRAQSGQSTEAGVTSNGPSFVETDMPTPQTTPHAAPPQSPSARAPLSGTELFSFQVSSPRHLQVCSDPPQPEGPMSGRPSPLNQHVALCGQQPRRTPAGEGPSCRRFTSATTVAASAQAAWQATLPPSSLGPGAGPLPLGVLGRPQPQPGTVGACLGRARPQPESS